MHTAVSGMTIELSIVNEEIRNFAICYKERTANHLNESAAKVIQTVSLGDWGGNSH